MLKVIPAIIRYAVKTNYVKKKVNQMVISFYTYQCTEIKIDGDSERNPTEIAINPCIPCPPINGNVVDNNIIRQVVKRKR